MGSCNSRTPAGFMQREFCSSSQDVNSRCGQRRRRIKGGANSSSSSSASSLHQDDAAAAAGEESSKVKSDCGDREAGEELSSVKTSARVERQSEQLNGAPGVGGENIKFKSDKIEKVTQSSQGLKSAVAANDDVRRNVNQIKVEETSGGAGSIIEEPGSESRGAGDNERFAEKGEAKSRLDKLKGESFS